MSVADVDICTVRSIIGGDCDLKNKQDISNTNQSNNFVKDIVNEVVENALDVALKHEYKEKNIAGDIFEKNTNEKDKSNDSNNQGENPPSFGVGDQLAKEDVLQEEIPNSKYPIVEKKNRLTDLVRNSKQILAKYLKENKKQAELEEKNEKVICVVDLDIGDDDMKPFKVEQTNSPKDIPLPDDDEDDLVEVDEKSMDDVQLRDEAATSSTAEYVDDCKKRMTFPMASGSSKSSNGLIAKWKTLKMNSPKLKEGKWSIKNKFIKYFTTHTHGKVYKTSAGEDIDESD